MCVCVCALKDIITAVWTIVWPRTLITDTHKHIDTHSDATQSQTVDLFDWINEEFLQLSSSIPTSGVNCIRAMEWRRIGS